MIAVTKINTYTTPKKVVFRIKFTNLDIWMPSKIKIQIILDCTQTTEKNMCANDSTILFNNQIPEQYDYAWIFDEADIEVEVANFCAAMDTLVDQDAGCKLLCNDGHLGRPR